MLHTKLYVSVPDGRASGSIIIILAFLYVINTNHLEAQGTQNRTPTKCHIRPSRHPKVRASTSKKKHKQTLFPSSGTYQKKRWDGKPSHSVPTGQWSVPDREVPDENAEHRRGGESYLSTHATTTTTWGTHTLDGSWRHTAICATAPTRKHDSLLAPQVNAFSIERAMTRLLPPARRRFQQRASDETSPGLLGVNPARICRNPPICIQVTNRADHSVGGAIGATLAVLPTMEAWITATAKCWGLILYTEFGPVS